MTREELVELLTLNSVQFHMTGSRYICNPVPMDTDEDYVILMNDIMQFESLGASGFEITTDQESYEDLPSFLAMRLNEFNLVVTYSKEFYERFVDATNQAKELNLLKKADRISLFQSVLYGEPAMSAELPF